MRPTLTERPTMLAEERSGSQAPGVRRPTPLRVAIDVSLACSRRPTGVEHFARALLAELVRIPSSGVAWYLYLPPYGDPGCSIPDGVTARYRPDVNTLVKAPWLAAQTWRDRVDVLYSFGHLFPRGCRGRMVLTVHDTAFDAYPDCYAPGIAARAHAEVAATCARARRLVVPSEATRRNLMADYGYPPDRIDVILEGGREGFAPGPAGPLPARVREAGVVAPFLLCVGRLDRRKNLERAVQAYRDLLRRGVPVGGLVIAGPDDSGSPELRDRLSRDHVPGERIVTTGYVTDAELVSLYRSAAVLVYPSLAEGFGLPVLEAMACGTPVVTSQVSSLPEVAGTAALLIDPTDVGAIGEAVSRILHDERLRSRLVAAGLERARELTWRASAERLIRSLHLAGAGS